MFASCVLLFNFSHSCTLCPWYVGSAGSIEQLLEEYINNMDLPVNNTSAFFKCSSSQSFSLSPFNSSPGSQLSLIDQRLKMIGMSTISQLCHVVFECICLLRGGDSDTEDTEGNSSTLNPAKTCYEKLVRTYVGCEHLAVKCTQLSHT